MKKSLVIILLVLILSELSRAGKGKPVTKMYGIGYQFRANLGDGTTTTRRTPVESTRLKYTTSNKLRVKKLRSNKDWQTQSSLAVGDDGQLWGWGYNFYKHVGPTFGTSLQPKRVLGGPITTSTKIVDASLFYVSSLVLTDKGDAIFMGKNDAGQRGNGQQNNGQTNPALIPEFAGQVKLIASGYNFNIIALKNNTVWGTGINGNGQLATNDTTNRNVWTESPSLRGVVLKQISCGRSYCLAVGNTGKLWYWGLASNGEFGFPNPGKKINAESVDLPIGPVDSVQTAQYSSAFILANKTVYISGKSYQGHLGGNKNTATLLNNDYGPWSYFHLQYGQLLAYKDNKAKVGISAGDNGFSQCWVNVTGNTIQSFTAVKEFPVAQNGTLIGLWGHFRSNGWIFEEELDCGTGVYGDDCEVFDCFGILSNSSSVCTGNGTCTGVNTCSCNSGYNGTQCETYDCYGKKFNDPKVCSGFGSCTSPDTCQCPYGYNGTQCEDYSCGVLPYNDTNVCSGNGVCESLDKCVCRNGYTGTNCEIAPTQAPTTQAPTTLSGSISHSLKSSFVILLIIGFIFF